MVVGGLEVDVLWWLCHTLQVASVTFCPGCIVMIDAAESHLFSPSKLCFNASLIEILVKIVFFSRSIDCEVLK